jgi:hypothetical protein
MAPERYKAVTQSRASPPSSPHHLPMPDRPLHTLSSFGSLLDELPDWLPEARFSTLRLDAGRHDFSPALPPIVFALRLHAHMGDGVRGDHYEYT